jgi:hypothetical protein
VHASAKVAVRCPDSLGSSFALVKHDIKGNIEVRHRAADTPEYLHA